MYMDDARLLQGLLAPNECLWCGADLSQVLDGRAHGPGFHFQFPEPPLHRNLCAACFESIREYASQCLVCGQLNGAGRTCRQCQKKTPFQTRIVAARYADPLMQSLIQRFKYGLVADLVIPIGELLTEAVRSALSERPAKRTLVTAVPLTRRRQRWRGFNQAEVIAYCIARDLSLPYSPVAARIRGGPTLAKIAPAERQPLIRGAFKANELPFRFERIIYVDDVWGSGATLTELARATALPAATELWAAVAAA